jgi:hypothetical protein
MSGFMRPPAVEELKYAGNKPGKDGANGKDGTPGRDGIDGKDGRGITGFLIAGDGSLVVKYTDGVKENLGVVVGRDGKDGIGIKGDKGDRGDKGDKGDKGEPGIGRKGDKGDPGDKGEPGQSIKGDKGDSGESIKGDKGEPGATGPRGESIKGDKGETGQSIKGDKGDPGRDGKDGRDGLDLTVAPSRPAGRVLMGAVGRLTADRKPPGPTNTLNIPDGFTRAVTLLIVDGVGAGAKIEGLHACADGVVTWDEWSRVGNAGVTVDADQQNRGLAVTAMTAGSWTCRMIGSPE